MKSLIGKDYIPFDNSWSVNVTKSGSYPYNNEQGYLAGAFNRESKVCKIVSEPFECNTFTFGIENSYDVVEMIMVCCDGETHMTMFNKDCVR